MNLLLRWFKIVAALGIGLMAIMIIFQRKLLFHPSHHEQTNGLVAWTIDGRFAGYARKAANPATIWLFTHGNAGQAADRDYALPCFSPADAVFILEYPGYGRRAGRPGKVSFNAAAAEAYRELRTLYPDRPVCVVGESIGSGPAASLAAMVRPPDRIVLVVPFDNLASVVRDHFPFIPAQFVLLDRWDNSEALRGYGGRIDIYAAVDDQVIPVYHAQALAESLPGTVLHEIPGGHNDWAQSGQVKFRH